MAFSYNNNNSKTGREIEVDKDHKDQLGEATLTRVQRPMPVMFLWLVILIFDLLTQNKWVFRSHRGTFLRLVWWFLAASVFSGRELAFTFAISYGRSVCLSVVCRLSVVCNVGAPYSAGWNFRQFFSPYDSTRTLVFWCQNSFVGDAPFPLKFSFKVTHPLSNSAISTNIGS